MKSKGLFITIYICIGIAAIGCFHPYWLKPMPTMAVYQGELYFSGQRTYEQLEGFIKQYPDRVIGSQNAKKSAVWIEEQFKQLGVKAKIDEFECLSPNRISANQNLMRIRMDDLGSPVQGYNVIGVSPGKSKEIILIGAHRDIIGSIEGAEDNGTGTITMLELARILTEKEHEYTYMFVSFDGEEIGLKGSAEFIRKYPTLPIKVAVILDMTGFHKGDRIRLYQYASGRGASPLWTTVLAQNVGKSQGIPVEYFRGFRQKPESIGDVFSYLIGTRIGGIVNTDSGPFVDRGMAAVGISIDGDPRKRVHAEIHSHKDVMAQVSAEVLEHTGRFTEQYIKSIELQKPTGELQNRLYIIWQNHYFSIGIYLFLGIFLGGSAVLFISTCRSSNLGAKKLVHLIVEEKMWLGMIVLFSGLYAGFYWLVLQPITASFPIVPFLGLGWAIFLGVSLLLLYLRRQWMCRYRNENREMILSQKPLLHLIYMIIFLGLMIFYQPIVAVFLTVIPILIMSRVQYGHRESRQIWIVGFIGWSIIHLILTLLHLSAYAFEPVATNAIGMLFASTLIWISTVIYGFSNPSSKVRKGSDVLEEEVEVHRS